MENIGGVVVLMSVLALFPSLKLVAELIDLIGRKIANKINPEVEELRDHIQEL